MYEKKNSVSSLFPTAMRSIEFGIPLPFPEKMLSNYSEFRPKASQQQQQNLPMGNQVSHIQNQDAEALEHILDLKSHPLTQRLSEQKSVKKQSIVESPITYSKVQKIELLPEHREGIYQDTKNLLRNYGNAQNQFILYNERAKQITDATLQDSEKFYNWVRKLKLQNFQQFKKVWNGNMGTKLYTRLYKQLCWKFYVQEAVSYVLMSRMKNQVTKMTHLKYVHRFLEGIKDPQNFKYFKKQ